MIVKIFIENTQIDLFQDESIEINSSIANIDDVSKNTTDYSKSFTVPATDKNNEFFKHYYNANIDNTFDARTKVAGFIELDGMPFKYGKWRLEKVNIKQGNASSYTITFFGNLVSLKDKFGDDELTVLDFTSLDFAYTDASVVNLLNDKDYPIIATLTSQSRLYYNSDNSANDPNNLARSGVKWNDILLSLKLKSIIDAIQVKYGITFSSDFFNTTQFTDLYLLLNNNVLNTNGKTKKIIDWTDSGGSPYINLATNEFSLPSPPILRIAYTIFPKAGFETAIYQVQIYRDEVLIQDSGLWFGEFQFSTYLFPSGTYNLKFLIIADNFEFIAHCFQEGAGSSPDYTTVANDNFVTSIYSVNNNLPKIKIIDFMAGLFKAFKLVVIADEYSNVYVDTLVDYYLKGGIIDVSKYINNDSIDVSRGDILNEINFKFQDPTTILNIEFKKNELIAYGDENAKIQDENGKPLDGTALSIELPFEQIVYERLRDGNDLTNTEITNIQIASVIDEEFNRVVTKPHIHYAETTDTSNYPVKIIGETGMLTVTQINNISYSDSFILPTNSFLFSAEYDTYTRNLLVNNLYSNYWDDYITSLFNIKRRSFVYKGILPLSIMLQLKLNSALKINENYYRINNYNLNLLNGETTLNLINSFDDELQPFTAYPVNIGSNALGRMVSVKFTNLGSFTTSILPSNIEVDSIEEDVINFNILENLTTDIITNNVTVTRDSDLKEIRLNFYQTGI